MNFRTLRLQWFMVRIIIGYIVLTTPPKACPRSSSVIAKLYRLGYRIWHCHVHIMSLLGDEDGRSVSVPGVREVPVW